jgi:hypothetical protein
MRDVIVTLAVYALMAIVAIALGILFCMMAFGGNS